MEYRNWYFIAANRSWIKRNSLWLQMVFRMVWIRAKIDFLEIVIVSRGLEIEFKFARTFAEYQLFNIWYRL